MTKDEQAPLDIRPGTPVTGERRMRRSAGINTAFRAIKAEHASNRSPMEVLAEGKNLKTGKTYPVLWVTKHPKARIVCCTLGHDASCHDSAAYKTFLQNSLAWLSGK